MGNQNHIRSTFHNKGHYMMSINRVNKIKKSITFFFILL